MRTDNIVARAVIARANEIRIAQEEEAASISHSVDIAVQIAACQAVIDNWNEQRWVRAVQAHADAAWNRGIDDPAYI